LHRTAAFISYFGIISTHFTSHWTHFVLWEDMDCSTLYFFFMHRERGLCIRDFPPSIFISRVLLAAFNTVLVHLFLLHRTSAVPPVTPYLTEPRSDCSYIIQKTACKHYLRSCFFFLCGGPVTLYAQKLTYVTKLPYA
ncbi:hypothetical protein IscW_ISCW005194, partial [Ixodes scapularis]